MTPIPYCFIHRLRWSLRALRQWVGLAVVSASLASSILAADTTNYTFTDQQGRTLVAEIIRVVEPDVYLQSGDGEPFPVKIGVFIAKDQSYIRQWALNNQKTAEPFAIFALRNTLVDSNSPLPEQGFTVTLKNFSGATVTDLRVDYIVLRQPTQNATAPLPRINGMAEIPSIANKGEATFETDRIPVKGNRLAVWVRVYNSKGVLLQEWSSSPEMTKDEQWNVSDPKPSKSFGTDSKSGKSSK